MPSVPKPKYKKREEKRPAVKEACPLEETEQNTVIAYLRVKKILHTANVPDRRYCKQNGYSKGVPDIFIFDRPATVENGKVYSGCALEMKRRKGGVLSPEQRAWLSSLQERGWLCYCAHGCDDALEFLKRNVVVRNTPFAFLSTTWLSHF